MMFLSAQVLIVLQSEFVLSEVTFDSSGVIETDLEVIFGHFSPLLVAGESHEVCFVVLVVEKSTDLAGHPECLAKQPHQVAHRGVRRRYQVIHTGAPRARISRRVEGPTAGLPNY